MHATRIATFLLGGWIIGSLLAGALSFINVRLAENFLYSPMPQAEQIAKTAGMDQERLLLRHFASEEYRLYFRDWGLMQVAIGLVTLGVVYFAADRRLLPVILAGLMLIFVLFQYFAIAPELTYRGRETDFPPGQLSLDAEARHWAMLQVYIGVEAVKLLIGGVLASYIFAYKSRRRSRSTPDPLQAGRLTPARP